MPKFSSTMKASSRRTLRRRRLRIIIGSVFVALLLLFATPRFLGFVASTIFTPIASLEMWSFNVSSILPAYFVERQELLQTINQLESRLGRESVTTGSTELLARENAELRDLLGTNQSGERIAAGVLGRPSVTPYDVLIIDKGSRDGVVVSAPVYIGAHEAIGYVEKVFPDSSVVILATSPNVESTAYIFGPNIYTTARGQGGGVLEVKVPQGIALSVGDLVVLPALGSGLYGKITLVDSVPTEPEQRGYVTQSIPLQSLRVVSVGTQSLTPQSFAAARETVEAARETLLKVPVPEGVLVDVLEDTASSTSASSTTASSTEEIE